MEDKPEVFMARQGDLLIRRIPSIPKDIKTTLKSNKTVLEGEITNHNHDLVDGQVLLVSPGQERAFEDGEAPHAFLEIDKDTELVHPEHDTVPLKAGNYEVIRQRERTRVVQD